MSQPISALGDGFCDDDLNTLECHYDKGDCCGTCPDFSLCEECVCYKLLNLCQFAEWVGDGICDDVTNNLNCDFDRGDCCDPQGDFTLCSKCECLDVAC